MIVTHILLTAILIFVLIFGWQHWRCSVIMVENQRRSALLLGTLIHGLDNGGETPSDEVIAAITDRVDQLLLKLT